MNLYPAIDILEGNAVRLTRGDFHEKKVYDQDPLEAATGWVRAGGRFLHVVDLDGAREGRPVNLDHLRRIAEELDVPVQYGGGLRTAQAVGEALDAGATRVILGTAAFTHPELLDSVLADHGPERVLVSVDVRSGLVSTAGWQETTELRAIDVIDRLHEQGVRELVYTNVDRDGMLEGPDLEEVSRVSSAVLAIRGSLIYSGGIGSLADLEALMSLSHGGGLDGVIVGKALYERHFTIAEAHAALTT
jgi:phosphoribosylformimino-5-aminoimidazole carboxamide ribotide isomerase